MANTLNVTPTPSPMGRRTLGRKLVIRVVALVALVALLLSAFTTLATRQLLIGQLDDQLDGVIGRQQKSDTGGGRPPRGQPPGGVTQYGQPIGTLIVVFEDDDTRAGVLREGGADQITVVVGQQIEDELVLNQKKSVLLDDLGRYRIYARQLGASNTTVVVGLPLAGVDRNMANLIGWAIALTLLATGIAAIAARALVERSLRPLHRVAATAKQVSELQLAKGEVETAVRVPEADTDPDSEVGRVGLALNHLLNNVDDALAARQASEMKVRQFVADASHELRNPLAAIRGYAELTRRGRDQIPADAAYAMSRVEAESNRMSRLVEDLLLLARLDSGPALDLEPVDLTELVINAANDARAAGPEHVWALDLPDQPVTAIGDQHRLHQVVTNLLANARTHTPAGTRVETGIAIINNQAVISVTDNGRGIPAELQDQVFERFTRADASRVRSSEGGSTGLGLAIVAAVIDAHHGHVEVESEPGRTTFSIRLPLEE